MEIHGTVVPKLDRDLLEKSGIDIHTYDALLHVFEAGKQGVRMADLAAAVVISKSGITSLVDRLEAGGSVQRNPDPDDRRATRITLTPLGEETFRAAAQVHLASIEAHFASLITDEEAQVISKTLDRVRCDGETQA
ncbi:transcriptional activatory protein BadR [bacterium BMS3Bbin02]|nr:transcriptional activatory protein BadR [bacterium BMS3Bbin02]